jgi:hypothetical protein
VGFVGLPGEAVVVLADWKAFGALLVPGWGDEGALMYPLAG